MSGKPIQPSPDETKSVGPSGPKILPTPHNSTSRTTQTTISSYFRLPSSSSSSSHNSSNQPDTNSAILSFSQCDEAPTGDPSAAIVSSVKTFTVPKGNPFAAREPAIKPVNTFSHASSNLKLSGKLNFRPIRVSFYTLPDSKQKTILDNLPLLQYGDSFPSTELFTESTNQLIN